MFPKEGVTKETREEAELDIKLQLEEFFAKNPTPPNPPPNRRWSCRLGSHDWYRYYEGWWREKAFREDGTENGTHLFMKVGCRCAKCGGSKHYEGGWDLWEIPWGPVLYGQ